jgi:hypothetical protein
MVGRPIVMALAVMVLTAACSSSSLGGDFETGQFAGPLTSWRIDGCGDG